MFAYTLIGAILQKDAAASGSTYEEPISFDKLSTVNAFFHWFPSNIVAKSVMFQYEKGILD